MIYVRFIQRLGKPRISESAESRANSFSVESVFKLRICGIIGSNFHKVNNEIFVARYIHAPQFIDLIMCDVHTSQSFVIVNVTLSFLLYVRNLEFFFPFFRI